MIGQITLVKSPKSYCKTLLSRKTTILGQKQGKTSWKYDVRLGRIVGKLLHMMVKICLYCVRTQKAMESLLMQVEI